MVIALTALTQVNICVGLIGESTWREVMLGILFIFVGGNVAQKWSEHKTGVTHAREGHASAGNGGRTPNDVPA